MRARVAVGWIEAAPESEEVLEEEPMDEATQVFGAPGH